MDYQELINIWNSSDKELQENVQLNRKLIKEVGFKKIQSRLYEIKWTAFFHLIVGLFWGCFLIGFAVDHYAEFKFLAPAMILLAITSFSLLLEGYKLQQYYGIRSGDSVLQTQRKLARLRYFELLDIKSLLVIIPLFSAPFFIVTAKAFLNLDLYTIEFFEKGLLYYTLGSIVVAGILVLVLSRFPGKALQEAMAFLKELKEHEDAEA